MTSTKTNERTLKEPATGTNARVYLGGAINGCTDAECSDWREYAKKRLNAFTVDPMARDYRGVEDEKYQEIVEADKDDILTCQALLVMYEKPSVGTSMEMLYGWERGRVLALVVPKGEKISPWLRYHATRIFNTLDSAIDWLNEEV